MINIEWLSLSVKLQTQVRLGTVKQQVESSWKRERENSDVTRLECKSIVIFHIKFSEHLRNALSIKLEGQFIELNESQFYRN